MRLRLRFTKLGKVRFLGHRDLARLWERTLRRAELPVAYSEGFSPRPKVAFGLALSTGYESLGEYLDVDLDTSVRPVELVTLADRLTALLPDGIDVTAACEVSRSEPSLQQAVTSCSWSIEVVDVTVDEAAAITERALDAPSLVLTRERKGKQVTDDLRPALLDLHLVGPTPHGALLEAELGTQPRTLRPAELLAALDPPLSEGLVRRTHQWMTSDGARRDVVPVDATSAQHVGERAS